MLTHLKYNKLKIYIFYLKLLKNSEKLDFE
jgi:hypothetical protein